jgi:hypothetical protein
MFRKRSRSNPYIVVVAGFCLSLVSCTDVGQETSRISLEPEVVASDSEDVQRAAFSKLLDGSITEAELAAAVAQLDESVPPYHLDIRSLHSLDDDAAARRYLEGILSSSSDTEDAQLGKLWAAEAMAFMQVDADARERYVSRIRNALRPSAPVQVNESALFALGAVGNASSDAQTAFDWALRSNEYAIPGALALIQMCDPSRVARLARILAAYPENNDLQEMVPDYEGRQACP